MIRPGTNTGHGHVWSRPDGGKARCGGPAICSECATQAAELKAMRDIPDPAGWNRITELENRLQRIYNLFASGPDTICRTTWRRTEYPPVPLVLDRGAVECVEVPMEDLRDALDGPI